MLTNNLLEKINLALEAQIDERRRQIAITVTQLEREAWMNSNGNRNAIAKQLYKIFEKEVGIRAALVWQCISQVHREHNAAYSETLIADLTHLYWTTMNDSLVSLNHLMRQKLVKLCPERRFNIVDTTLHTVSKYEVEIRTYVESLQRKNGAVQKIRE